MIIHVIWKKDGVGGRLGVRIEDDNTLRVATLTGAALPARCLKAVLDAAIPGWAEIAEDLHLGQTAESPGNSRTPGQRRRRTKMGKKDNHRGVIAVKHTTSTTMSWGG